MEAFTAVGLAGNIVQFIDFTCNLFDQACSIYHSQTGSAQETQDLQTITRSLEEVGAKLYHAAQKQPQSAYLKPGRPQASLEKLAKDCELASRELLSALEGLKRKKPNSKWSSFRAALKSTWKAPRVKALEERLNSYRAQLVLQLQIMHDDENTGILYQLNDLNERSRRMGVALTDQIASLKGELQTATKALKIHLEDKNSKSLNARKFGEREKCNDSPIDASALADSLLKTETSGLSIVAVLALLDSLKFEQMEFRHSKIHDAHPQTFEWVFFNKFTTWLQSPEPIFWISGKPGSGKSTLMKYLVDNPETLRMIRSRKDSGQPVIASYFFWINGTELQRSQEGLLQSLLYEILRQCPLLIESTMPGPWKQMCVAVAGGTSTTYVWKRKDLLESFRRLSTLNMTRAHFCVFIDGLDEYKGVHDELIETIRYLTTMNVKMCVASRPWNVFEEEFGENENCKIYLQQLNGSDIKQYVNDKLRSRRELQSGQIDAAVVDTIIDDIVARSSGVFLWVFLVVRSLIEGLRNHDRLSQLRKRLEEFPTDLDGFFRHIFRSLDPTYRMQTTHMFQVTLAAYSPLTPLACWHLDEDEDQPNLALRMPVKAISTKTLGERTNEMQARINGRCKGLLEITPRPKGPDDFRPNFRVDFLHRTVKDFFMTTEMQCTLHKWQASNFDANMAICKALLAELKSLVTMPERKLAWVLSSITIFMHAAKEFELISRKPLVEHVDEIASTLRTSGLLRLVHDEDEDSNRKIWDIESALTVAVAHELLLYVEHKLASQDRVISLDEKFALLNPSITIWEEHREMSLEMACLVHRFGLALTVDADWQSRMVKQFLSRSREDTITYLTEICKTSFFEMSGGDFASLEFRNFLASKLDRKEIENILNNHTRPEKIQLSHNGGSDRTNMENAVIMKSGQERANISLRDASHVEDSNNVMNTNRSRRSGRRGLFRKIF